MGLRLAYINEKVLNKLRNRLTLTESELMPEAGMTSNLVQLTSDISSLFEVAKLSRETNDISAGSGVTTYWTVPANKRWRLLAFNRDTSTANTNGLIYDADGNLGFPISGSSTSWGNTVLGKDFIMEPDWTIRITNNGADATFYCHIWYIEEDLDED